MRLSAACMACYVRRQEEKIRECSDEALRVAYMRRVMEAILAFDPDRTSPVLAGEIAKIHAEMFGDAPDYSGIKHKYNKMVLDIREDIAERIAESPDPLAESLKYARAGNYIDFAAFKDISRDTLFALIDAVRDEELPWPTYDRFCRDLEKAERMVYLVDNCGEIVLDTLVVEELRRRYPNLSITAIVRGAPIYNDCTMEDAEESGMSALVPVLENGCAVAGTPLEVIGDEARAAIMRADVILAKGQGNFESMSGCGLNAYYLFLCKCDWFCRHFNCERNTGMFLREKDGKF